MFCHRPLVAMLAALIALTLAGCSANTDDPDETDERSNGGTTLETALGRIDAAAADSGLFIEFGKGAELAGLADQEAWKTTSFYGVSPLANLVTADRKAPFALDVGQADYQLTVGAPPSTVTLVSGGQDAAAVKSAAEKLGYSGDPLTKAMDSKVKETISVRRLTTLDSDVVLGGEKADLAWVDGDGPSLADDETISALAACLGELPAALIAEVDGTTVAAGPRPVDGGGVESVICTPGDQQTADAIVGELTDGTASSDKPFSTQFEAPAADVSDGVVRVTMRNADGLAAGMVVNLIIGRELPLD